MLVQYEAGGKSNQAEAYITLGQILGVQVTQAPRQAPEMPGLFVSIARVIWPVIATNISPPTG